MLAVFYFDKCCKLAEHIMPPVPVAMNMAIVIKEVSAPKYTEK